MPEHNPTVYECLPNTPSAKNVKVRPYNNNYYESTNLPWMPRLEHPKCFGCIGNWYGKCAGLLTGAVLCALLLPCAVFSGCPGNRTGWFRWSLQDESSCFAVLHVIRWEAGRTEYTWLHTYRHRQSSGLIKFMMTDPELPIRQTVVRSRPLRDRDRGPRPESGAVR